MTEKVETECGARCSPSCRAVLCFMGFLGGLIVYLMRTNISVAVVCMTTVPEGERNESLVYLPVVPQDDMNGLHDPEAFMLYSTMARNRWRKQDADVDTGEATEKALFDWSRDTRGLILSSFAFGYVCTQLLGGVAASRFGGKSVILAGQFVFIIGTFLSPVAAMVSPYALVAVQILKGLACGVYFPSFHSFWGHWAPPLERSTLVSLTFAGNSMGNILAFFFSGYLCEYVGWESLFYVYGGLAVAWFVCFIFLVFDAPENHPRISQSEHDYIERSIAEQYKKEEIVPIPWADIFKSPAVWAIAASEFGYGYGYYLILTTLPQYVVDVLEVDIAETGIYTAIPQLTHFGVCLICPFVADWMLRKGCQVVTVRKTMQSIAMYPAAIIMFVMGILTRDQMSIVLICLGLWGLCATYRSGSQTNQVEIAPRFAGIVMGCANTLASIPGMIAPSVTSALTPNGSRSEWQNAFIVGGILYIFSGTIYNLFARGDVQPWAMGKPSDRKSERDESKALLLENEQYKENIKYGSLNVSSSPKKEPV